MICCIHTRHSSSRYAVEPTFSNWTQISPNPDNTQLSVQISGLSAGKIYQFRIAAQNNAGASPFSSVKAHIVGTPPVAGPTGLGVVATTISSLTWNWDALDINYVGGASLAGYRLYMDRGLNDPTLYLVYDGTGSPSITQVTQSALTCGRTYRAQVSAVNGIGEGPLSAVVSANLAITPTQPANARVVSSSKNQVDLAWDVPFETGCAMLQTYRIERDDGNGFAFLAETNATTQAFSDTVNLVVGGMYIYRVAAKNDARNQYGLYSDYVTAYAATVPGLPINLGFSGSATRTSVSIKWDDPPVEGSGSPVRRYQVQVDERKNRKFFRFFDAIYLISADWGPRILYYDDHFVPHS